MMDSNSKIYIAGHTGFIGAALLERLRREGFKNIIYKERCGLNLCDQSLVDEFFDNERPDFVFICAARVGGISANISYPAEFLYENIAIQTNIIHCSYKYDVKKLLFFGSACSYPRECLQPMKEEYLLSGCLEPTNEAYAVAKIAGIKMCQAYNKQYNKDFIVCIPTNVYGIGDNFNIETSHVIPALIRKFHLAKKNNENNVIIWGSGSPVRDFIYLDDLVDAAVFLMKRYYGSDFINIASGEGTSIKNLADIIRKTVNFKGDIKFDLSKPDGAPRKVLDISKLKELGWEAKTGLKEGIGIVYKWYIDNLQNMQRYE